MAWKLLREEIRQLEDLLEETLRENAQLERENESMKTEIQVLRPSRSRRCYTRIIPGTPKAVS